MQIKMPQYGFYSPRHEIFGNAALYCDQYKRPTPVTHVHTFKDENYAKIYYYGIYRNNYPDGQFIGPVTEFVAYFPSIQRYENYS